MHRTRQMVVSHEEPKANPYAAHAAHRQRLAMMHERRRMANWSDQQSPVSPALHHGDRPSLRTLTPSAEAARENLGLETPQPLNMMDASAATPSTTVEDESPPSTEAKAHTAAAAAEDMQVATALAAPSFTTTSGGAADNE